MKDLSILLASYDKAYDFWHITAQSFASHWADNPYEIFLGANGEDHKSYCPTEWNYINHGPDYAWHQSMLTYLSSIKTDYVLVHLDDFALVAPVYSKKIQECVDFLKLRNGVYLRLMPKPRPNKKLDNYFGIISVGENVPYVTSLQPSIWNRAFLIELLKYEFNPWEFEVKGGKTDLALNNENAFYGVYEPVVAARHFVEKGNYLPFVRKLVSEDELGSLLAVREIWEKETVNDTIYSRLFNLVPSNYQNWIRRFFGRPEL
tara:strand:- start:2660 stop:3442 length:783 start_codon:yes stop_codon:yes gene_type:complete